MNASTTRPRPTPAQRAFALSTAILALSLLYVTFAMDVKWLRITVGVLMAMSALGLAWSSRRTP